MTIFTFYKTLKWIVFLLIQWLSFAFTLNINSSPSLITNHFAHLSSVLMSLTRRSWHLLIYPGAGLLHQASGVSSASCFTCRGPRGSGAQETNRGLSANFVLSVTKEKFSRHRGQHSEQIVLLSFTPGNTISTFQLSKSGSVEIITQLSKCWCQSQLLKIPRG